MRSALGERPRAAVDALPESAVERAVLWRRLLRAKETFAGANPTQPEDSRPGSHAGSQSGSQVDPAQQSGPLIPAGATPRVSLRDSSALRSILASAQAARVWLDRALACLPLAGGKSLRLVLACPGPFPAPEGGHMAWEARHLLGGGFDVRLLAWSRGRSVGLDGSERMMLRRTRALSTDRAVHALDRIYWVRNDPSALAQVEAWLAAAPEQLRERLWTFARAAQGLRPGFLLGFGTGGSGILARGTAKLLGVPYGIAIGGGDASAQPADGDVRLRVLREAAVVVVDCAETGERVLELTGDCIQHLAIKPPSVYWEPPAEPAPPRARLRALVVPPIHRDTLLQLADALQQVVAGGGDVDLEVLPPAPVGGDVEADELRRRLEQHGIADRLVPAGDESKPLHEHIAGTDVLLALHRAGGGRDTSGIAVAVLAAMAAGIPVIAHRGGALDVVVGDQEEGLLVPPDDRRALGRAFARLTTDAELRAALGQGARRRFAAEFDPDAAGAALRGKLREVLVPKQRTPAAVP